MPDFLTVENARAMIPQAVRAFLVKAMAWDADGPDAASVAGIAASPGAGKSVETREVLAGDVVFYAPTLALADEAAPHAETLNAG